MCCVCLSSFQVLAILLIVPLVYAQYGNNGPQRQRASPSYGGQKSAPQRAPSPYQSPVQRQRAAPRQTSYSSAPARAAPVQQRAPAYQPIAAPIEEDDGAAYGAQQSYAPAQQQQAYAPQRQSYSAAAAAPLEEEGSAEPYDFQYDTTDEYGVRTARQESGDANGVVRGSYTIEDPNTGIRRTVNYEADENGFRATGKTGMEV